jgi:protein TonB
MPTDVLPTRHRKLPEESFSSGFVASISGHLLVVGSIIGAIWVGHLLNPTWGEADPTVGAIQISAVDSLPLPPKQPVKDNSVLTSDSPSVAPKQPEPKPTPPTKATPLPTKAEANTKPTDIPIKSNPVKATTKADQDQATTNRRPAAPSQPTEKATSGQTSGVQIPQSVTQTKNGTASVTIEDRAFGDRYAYYSRLVGKKIAESKAQDIDGPETKGKQTTVHFIIQRDGTPTDIQVIGKSGAISLDTSVLRAIQRIDSFGPLPAGDHLPVTYIWDSH